MEMESRTMRMLLQTMPKKGFVLTFVVFLILFAISVVIGALGPTVVERTSFSSWECPDGLSDFDDTLCTGVDLTRNLTRWSGQISGLDKLNQQLTLVVTINNKDFATSGSFKTIDFDVAISGKQASTDDWILLTPDDRESFYSREVSCDQNKPACDNITLGHEPFILYQYYQFNVSLADTNEYDFIGDIYFSFIFVHHEFTLFELWFRFAFLMLTFVVVILFAHRLRFFKWADWTVEQKWTAVLLFGLMGFNNPFFPLEILVDGWVPIFLDTVFLVTFTALLLLFWLVMFDGIRKESQQHTFQGFYIPKILLVFLIWLCRVILFTWEELHELDDPVYSTASEIAGYVFFLIFQIVLFVLYVIWLIYAIVRACGQMQSLPYLGVRIRFFGFFTLLIIVVTIGGVVFDVYGPIKNNSAEFLSFLSLFNLYVYTLAFVYLPSKQAFSEGTTKDSIGMVKLEDEQVYSEEEEQHERIELPPEPKEDSDSQSNSSSSSSS